MPSIIKVDQIQSDTGSVNIASNIASNLSFTGTGRRITGDFSNATISNRVAFQTSTTNGRTVLGLIPNGTGNGGNFVSYNTSDPANSGFLGVYTTNAGSFIDSGITGTGTYLPLTMYTGGSARMNITTAGVVELTSGQLKFPASQAASADPNTLDDYEEGSFSPIIVGVSTAGTVTYVNQQGNYVKIGRHVTVFVHLNWNSGTGSGNLRVSGLPFAQSLNNNYGAAAVYVDSVSITSGNDLQAYIGPGESHINLIQYSSASGGTATVPYDAAGVFLITMSYMTD